MLSVEAPSAPSGQPSQVPSISLKPSGSPSQSPVGLPSVEPSSSAAPSHAPSFRPSSFDSIDPNGDATITVVIGHDTWPGETGWMLVQGPEDRSSIIPTTRGTVFEWHSSAADGVTPNEVHSWSLELSVGINYGFQVTDSYGDGMFDPAFFRLDGLDGSTFLHSDDTEDGIAFKKATQMFWFTIEEDGTILLCKCSVLCLIASFLNH